MQAKFDIIIGKTPEDPETDRGRSGPGTGFRPVEREKEEPREAIEATQRTGPYFSPNTSCMSNNPEPSPLRSDPLGSTNRTVGKGVPT